MGLTKMVDGISVDLTPQEEIQMKAEWQANVKEKAKTAYKKQRQQAYPTVNEQLEALWSVVESLQTQKIDIGVEGTDLLSKINGVKDRFPKSPKDTVPDPTKSSPSPMPTELRPQ